MGKERQEPQTSFVRRVLIVLGLASAFVIMGALLYAGIQVFLLLFAAVLFAILLNTLTDLGTRYLSLRRGISLGVVCMLFFLVVAGLIGLLGTQIAAQFDELGQALRSAWTQLTEYVRQYQWGQQLLDQTSLSDAVSNPSALLSRVTGVVSTTLGGLTNVLIILILGIYLAASPRWYQQGAVRLFPIDARPRAAEVFNIVGNTLRWWLLARLLTMTVVGVATYFGLLLLGIPLALSLSVIAFLLAFIPYLGPLIAAAPAILVGMTAEGGAINGLYVALLYFAIQTVESYLVQPLVEKRAVNMPPAVLLTSQMLLGILLGTMGVILASPLAAAALVLVKEVYVKDTLGDNG